MPRCPIRSACLLIAAFSTLPGCSEPPRPARPDAAPAKDSTPQSPSPEPSTPDAGAPTPTVEIKDPQLSDAEQAEALKKGKAALRAGQTEAAYRMFRSAMGGPDLGAAISGGLAAAELAEILNRPDEAEALYERLLSRGNEMAEVHLVAGRFFSRRGDAARGIDALRVATRLQPDLIPAWLSLGQILIERGRNTEGAAALLEYEQRLGAMTQQLEDEQIPVGDRLAIVQLMGTLNDERSTQILIGVLKSPEPLLRAAAGESLSDDSDPQALVALSEAALAEQDPRVKRALAAALLSAREAVRRTLDPATAP